MAKKETITVISELARNPRNLGCRVFSLQVQDRDGTVATARISKKDAKVLLRAATEILTEG